MHRFRLRLLNGPRVVRNFLRERRWIGHILHGKSLAFEGEGACFRRASQRNIMKKKDVETYEASISEGRHRGGKALYN